MVLRLPKALRRSRRSEIVRAALWTVDHNDDAIYSEGSNRLFSVKRPYQVPFVSDCSSGVTALYFWGGAPDPNELNYAGDPYTGTLVAHGRPIAASKARSADVVIFGPGTGWHAALVTQGGSDPFVWSMGEQGDPHLYRASVVEQAVAYVNHVDTCQVRYFRFNTSLR